MKRDLNLAKLILQKLEQKQDFSHIKDEDFHIDDYDQKLVEYHLIILTEAGYIQGASMRRESDDALIDVYPERLTWEGHEFLDSIKEKRRWEKIKQVGGKMSFEAIKFFALELMKKEVGEIL